MIDPPAKKQRSNLDFEEDLAVLSAVEDAEFDNFDEFFLAQDKTWPSIDHVLTEKVNAGFAVQAKIGVCDNGDLSASRDNNQLDRYVAWQPDPGALQIDTCSPNWNEFLPYCFPPFCLIPRILQRLKLTEADCTLIVPLWVTQPLYTKLLYLLIDTPVLLPIRKNLVIRLLTGKVHPTLYKTRFLACRLSGKFSKNQEFPAK